jgi:hypothetical protein
MARFTDKPRSLSSRASSAAAPEAAAAPRLPPARATLLRLLRHRVVAVLPSGGSVVGKGESLSLSLFFIIPGGAVLKNPH